MRPRKSSLLGLGATRFVLLGFLTCVSSWSQETRSVHGVVTDQNGKPIERAAVQLENSATLGIRSFITQADGAFHFSGVRRDIDYEVSAMASGVRSETRTVSKFNSRDDVEVLLRVQLNER